MKEDETDQAIEEPDEIMHINRDSENAVAFLSYPRHALLKRYLAIYLANEDFDKLSTVCSRKGAGGVVVGTRIHLVLSEDRIAVLDTHVWVARLMVDNDESGAVTIDLTINLTSRPAVAPLPS
ncbi:hypothetical protein TNCV_3814861 [Trichonephila clavipes]|nr:hypothetical protein TNCV_3814861 [Trichonephila clavipes]